MQTVLEKISTLLAKDNLGRNVWGIYHIPCECGKVYEGQTGHTIKSDAKHMNATSDSINQRNTA
jgi:hypothetical protein